MIAQRLIETAQAAGLSFEVEGGDLIVEAERDPPAELLTELRQHKAELIEVLRHASDNLSVARQSNHKSDTCFAFGPPGSPAGPCERADLVECGMDVPRRWAEGCARLSPERPPSDVPPHRWQMFVDDVGRFLDSGFADQASALGWTAYDLFGADDDKPFARIDKAGLLWLLCGAKLVALSENTATIEVAAGIRQTFRRKATEPGHVLAWEMAL